MNQERRQRALEAITAALADAFAPSLDDVIANQMPWSEETFGPGLRTDMLIDHIKDELREIAAEPMDAKEWAGIVLLGIDGLWRVVGDAAVAARVVQTVQADNRLRKWPDWRTMDPTKRIEHIKTVAEVRSDSAGDDDVTPVGVVGWADDTDRALAIARDALVAKDNEIARLAALVVDWQGRAEAAEAAHGKAKDEYETMSSEVFMVNKDLGVDDITMIPLLVESMRKERDDANRNAVGWESRAEAAEAQVQTMQGAIDALLSRIDPEETYGDLDGDGHGRSLTQIVETHIKAVVGVTEGMLAEAMTAKEAAEATRDAARVSVDVWMRDAAAAHAEVKELRQRRDDLLRSNNEYQDAYRAAKARLREGISNHDDVDAPSWVERVAIALGAYYDGDGPFVAAESKHVVDKIKQMTTDLENLRAQVKLTKERLDKNIRLRVDAENRAHQLSATMTRYLRSHDAEEKRRLADELGIAQRAVEDGAVGNPWQVFDSVIIAANWSDWNGAKATVVEVQGDAILVKVDAGSGVDAQVRLGWKEVVADVG